MSVMQRVFGRHGFYQRNVLICGGAVAPWLVRSTPDQAVQVRALAGDIVLCSWTGQITLAVPLSIQVHKLVAANLILGTN